MQCDAGKDLLPVTNIVTLPNVPAVNADVPAAKVVWTG